MNKIVLLDFDNYIHYEFSELNDAFDFINKHNVNNCYIINKENNKLLYDSGEN